MKIHCPRCRKAGRNVVVAVWLGDTITAHPTGGSGIMVQGVDRATFYCRCGHEWVVRKQQQGGKDQQQQREEAAGVRG